MLEPYEAASALLALGLGLNLLVLADSGRARVSWRALLPPLIAALPGLALGVLALELLPKAALQLGVGVAVVVAAASRLRAPRAAP